MDIDTSLPAAPDQVLRNLETALATIGSGGGAGGLPGVQYSKVDSKTGAFVYGRDNTPVPLKQRFAVPPALIRGGFKVWEGGVVVAQVMEPIVSNPLPVPKGGRYVAFGENGPRKAIEAIMLGFDEPGFNLAFSALSISNENGVARVVADAAAQIRAGHKDYSTPLIQVVPQLCNYRRFGTTGWAFGHKLIDYVSTDGTTLWSKVKQVADPGDLPWDTGNGDDGEKL
jgi:hypothetical protein